MFQIKQNPTFDANITFTGQGREQTLAVTFKAKPRSEFQALFKKVDFAKSETAVALLAQLIDKWDADMDVSEESLKLLADHQPGAEWALLGAYQESLMVERKGN
jgi:hypothetical protein